MTTTYLAPNPIQNTQFIPGGAVPANGAQMFFYAAGSTAKQTAYKDNAGSVAWSNPIVLDSGGNLPLNAEVWFTTGQTYKVVLAPSNDTDPPASPYWTRDNLAGINDTTSSQSEWIAGPTPTYIGTTSFSVAGDQTGTFQVGRRVKTTNTAGTVYSRITASVYTSLTTVTVSNDGTTTLDSGLSAVSYGLLSATSQAIPALDPAQTKVVGGTMTSSNPFALTQTWNSSSVTFTGLLQNITNSSSNAASLLLDLQVGGTTKFNISTSGVLSLTGKISGSTGGIDVPVASAVGNVYSSTYAPTMTGVTNVDSISCGGAQYFRLGNVGLVSGTYVLDATAANTATEFGIGLPIASNIANAWECCGVAGAAAFVEVMSIFGDAANDRAQVQGICGNTTAGHTGSFIFFYRII